MKWMPTLPEVAREAIIVMAGALLAAVIVRQLPARAQNWFSLPSNSR